MSIAMQLAIRDMVGAMALGDLAAAAVRQLRGSETDRLDQHRAFVAHIG